MAKKPPRSAPSIPRLHYNGYYKNEGLDLLPSRNICKWSWRIILCAFLTVLFALFGSSAYAEVIRQFDIDVTLNPNCSLDVIETIKMDFESSRRHGIFRIIPIGYSRYGGNYTLDFHLLNITDENNRSLNYRNDPMLGSDVNIKIGDPNKRITGEHTYRIHYLVRRAVNFFNGAPEVYWNATGNDWPFGIEKADVRFYPPTGVSINNIKTASYVGPIGSTTPGEISKSDSYIEFKANNLKAGSGLTIVAGLPVGCVSKTPLWQEIVWFLFDWWGLLVIPLITCAWILPILLPRVTNPDGNQAIAPEWSPPKDLSPAEAGTLVDESCDMRDIVSTLVDLAARGYLQIKEIKAQNFLFFSDKDYEFIRTSSSRANDILSPHEQKFLQALFGFGTSKSSVKLSDLRDNFYTHIPDIRQAIYQSLTDKKLFVENPETVRASYSGWAIVIWAVGVLLMYFTRMLNIMPIMGGVFISGLIVFIAAQYMPARTRAGWKERAECLGFQRFVRLAEKDRIAVLAKEDPTIFGRLLPYAMVLGAADQWAEAFHGLLTEPPSWYVPYGYGTASYNFSSRNFVNDLGHGMNTMGHTFASMPASSAGSGGSGFSGGFSGGGFGGGGGGSW